MCSRICPSAIFMVTHETVDLMGRQIASESGMLNDVGMPANMPVLVPSAASSANVAHRSVTVVNDDRALNALIERLFAASGLSKTELSNRLGIKLQSFNQYLRFRRRNPSVLWMVRLAESCGGHVVIEFPERAKQ